MTSPPRDLGRREMCVKHGWVGRVAFVRDRHDLCEVPSDAASTPAEQAPARSPATPRRRRRRAGYSRKTVHVTSLDVVAGQEELVTLGIRGPHNRPRTRADCEHGIRPCPYALCVHNLYLDVSKTGAIIYNFPRLEPEEMPADKSCVLDLAALGGLTLEEVAELTNLTRERVRQIEKRALHQHARPLALKMGLGDGVDERAIETDASDETEDTELDDDLDDEDADSNEQDDTSLDEDHDDEDT